MYILGIFQVYTMPHGLDRIPEVAVTFSGRCYILLMLLV